MAERDLLGELRTGVAAGRMLVVVGAGVSIAATAREGAQEGSRKDGERGVASWTGLLRDGAERCVAVSESLPEGWAGRIHAEIDSGDLDELLSAAEKISRKLGAPAGPEYARWLRETVGALCVQDRSVLDAIRGLGLPIATTNYDGLLEEVTGLRPVTWREGERVERVIRGDEEAILHLHGFWAEPESVVLGIRSYEQVLGDAHAQTMMRAIRATRGLLFIGCGAGIADPDFDALLRWTRTVFEGSGYNHFQLCLEGEVADLCRLHPPDERLFPLPYGAEHSSLEPFLRGLRPKPGSRETGRRDERIALAGAAPGLPDAPVCFGREREVDELVSALCLEVPLPIPVLGPPGIGKTTVLLTALYDPRLAEQFGERRFYVTCEPAACPGDIEGVIASHLAQEDSQGSDDPLAALGEAPAVLVLDHAEVAWGADPLGFEGLLARLDRIEGLSLVVSLRGEERPLGPRWRDSLHIVPLPLAAARDQLLSTAGERFRPDPDLDQLLEAVDRLPLAVFLLARLAEGETSLAGLRKRWEEMRREMILRNGARDGRTAKIDVCRALAGEVSPRRPERTGTAPAGRAVAAAPVA
jgi:hypothetical protein